MNVNAITTLQKITNTVNLSKKNIIVRIVKNMIKEDFKEF